MMVKILFNKGPAKFAGLNLTGEYEKFHSVGRSAGWSTALLMRKAYEGVREESVGNRTQYDHDFI